MFYLDSASLIDLYHKYRSQLITSIARLTGCHDTAADLAQEAYIRLLVNGSMIKITHPTAYLFRIGHNLAIDYQRNPYSKAEYLQLEEELVCPLLPPEELVSLRQQCEILVEAVASMPKPSRNVFLLRKIDELSFAQIAAKLRISEKTVQRRLVRAMLHCIRHMNNPCPRSNN